MVKKGIRKVITPEEKQLLLKDLCARLPYGLKLRYVEDLVVTKESHIITLNNIYLEHILNGDADIKPYLRPMSSMTEEEKHKLLKFGVITCLENGEVIDVSCVGFERHADVQDYLNTCHFDYRGLIHIGLALEAPEGMYIKK